MSHRAQSYLGHPLSVLALWQPFATLAIAPDPEHAGEPAKAHETRHWFPFEQLPLRVAVHASKKFDKFNREYFTAPRFRDVLKRTGFYPGDPRPFTQRKLEPPNGLKPVPLGAIIGVATITEVLCASTPPEGAVNHGVRPLNLAAVSEDDRAFGYFVRNPEDAMPYRYAWRLEHAVLLPEPVPHTGRQEPLYPLDIHTLEAIGAQLKSVP